MTDAAHELVSMVKVLASELGQTPTRKQFTDRFPKTNYDMRHVAGGFTVILQMAGLETYHKPKAKITNEVFRTTVAPVLEEYVPRDVVEQPVWPKILVLGDAHFPWVSKRALEKVYDFAQDFQPEHIVQMGDLYDFLSHSKFPRSHQGYSAQEEQQLARQGAEEMWRELQKQVPGAKCHLITGNHDLRPLKRVLETAPMFEHWAEEIWRKLMTFDGVETIYDHRTELEIAGILFTHGFLGKEGAHRDYYLKNVCIGHLHKGWVQYRRFHGQAFFEVCAGFLGEPESKALTYNNSKLANYQLGFAAIDQFGPRFIHL